MTNVVISHEDKRLSANVLIQSPNKKSLAVMFEGVFLGYLGMMPLYWDDARQCYVDLFFGNAVQVRWLNPITERNNP